MQRDNGTKSGNDIPGYATLFRGYDTEGGRWNMIDPKWRVLPSESPYIGMGNNPVNMIDPLGDKNLNFNINGKYLGVTDDNFWHNNTTEYGVQGRVFDNKGNLLRTFQFADPIEDVEKITKGDIKKLVIVKESQIRTMINNAGAFEKENKTDNNKIRDRYKYILKEGKGDGGKFDFSYSQIPYMFPGSVLKPLLQEPTEIYLVDGMAHNQMNFGNFLYGAAGQALGLTSLELCAGAHYNSLFNSETNGYPSQPDSPDDQRSIIEGFNFGEKNLYKNLIVPKNQDPNSTKSKER